MLVRWNVVVAMPECVEIECPSISRIPNGVEAGADCAGGGVHSGPTCSFTCESGYRIVEDESTITRDLTGTWAASVVRGDRMSFNIDRCRWRAGWGELRWRRCAFGVQVARSHVVTDSAFLKRSCRPLFAVRTVCGLSRIRRALKIGVSLSLLCQAVRKRAQAVLVMVC